MKDEWYGDKRDLAKWGVLVHLATRFRACRILQVPYYRPSAWEGLEIDGQPYRIPVAVVKHFRDIGNIGKLKAPCRIEVIETPFTNRDQYAHVVRQAIGRRGRGASIVFLDPDTGLAPRKPGVEHVLESELAAVWECLRGRDVLVLYQHKTNRNGRPWVEPKRQQFEAALGLPRGSSGLAHAPRLARDVAFLFASKETSPHRRNTAEDKSQRHMRAPARPQTLD